jgi:hypothetical protein
MSQPVVVFPHIEVHWGDADRELQRDLARIMVASVRRTMPGVPVRMITDLNTPAIAGIDVFRVDTKGYGEFIPWLCHACSMIEGEVLYLDSDVVVQQDLRPILNIPADLVLPYRGMKIVDDHMQPFIFGVVAYKTAAIWKEFEERVLKMQPKERMWYGSQIAACDMWMEENNGRGKWTIVPIPRDTYNYTPKDADDVNPEAWALHYKGKRKAWMRERWGHLIAEKVAA